MMLPPDNIAFIIDPLDSLNVQKDSTIAMMRAAQRKNWHIYTLQQSDIYTNNQKSRGRCLKIRITDDAGWYEVIAEEDKALDEMHTIMMRKDPPFDMEYITTTYLLDQPQSAGVLMVNPPQSLRNFNEKMFIRHFPQCCTPFLVSRNMHQLREFVVQQYQSKKQDVILKPLDGMGGTAIFRVNPHDPNLSVILESVSHHGTKTVMAQQFIPEIRDGDKRILLIAGQPVPYALARIPAQGETRGNLAAGGTGRGIPLSDRDKWICSQIAPMLQQQGILFAGIDVIGDYLTEINITSPTCIRELDKQYHLDIAGELMQAIDDHHKNKQGIIS